MSRRFHFNLKWLFVAMLAVGCFFSGIRFESERQRMANEAAALAAKNAEREEAMARSKQRIAVIAAEIDLQSTHIAAEGEARERIERELFLQEQKVDRLMDRFNALMDEERRGATPRQD